MAPTQTTAQVEDHAVVLVSENCWERLSFHGLYYVLRRDDGRWNIVHQSAMTIN